MTPDQLDQERWIYRGWKQQRGGWNQELWILINEIWRAWYEHIPKVRR